MGHHNHSIQWQHNHSTIRWRIRGNLQTISTTWRGWRNSPFVCSRLRKLNYPDEGVAEKGPETPARFMPPMKQTAAGVEASRHLETGSARVSVNSFAVTRCNEQVSNWSWLRRQEGADALVVIGNFFLLLWAFVCFCVCVCLQHGRVYIREHLKNCDNERREHHFSCYRGWLSCQVLAAGRDVNILIISERGSLIYSCIGTAKNLKSTRRQN